MRYTTIITLAVALLVAPSVQAVWQDVQFSETPRQDILPDGWLHVDELGWGTVKGGPFPTDEEIDTRYITTEFNPCPADKQQGINYEIEMTNLTPYDFDEVWYVADPDTFITNDDGLVNSSRAFEIDKYGANKPLVFESGTIPDVFESGETWKFVVQDWFNPVVIIPDNFDSIGVGSVSGGWPPSTGSIIAIPEPGTLSLLALGGLAALMRRRLA